jgi:hypothetical protein
MKAILEFGSCGFHKHIDIQGWEDMLTIQIFPPLPDMSPLAEIGPTTKTLDVVFWNTHEYNQDGETIFKVYHAYPKPKPKPEPKPNPKPEPKIHVEVPVIG